jgi:Uri superfamily endonuclease
MHKRIGRHLRRNKKKFWHIDYLTSETSFCIKKIYSINKPERLECNRARDLEKILEHIAGFGSTDCRCRSHLFFAGDKRCIPDMEKDFIIKSGFEEYNSKMIM